MSHGARGGFTLIELMVVVAIVGILSAIAIQEFSQLTLRTRRAEVAVNLDAIRTSELGYHAEWDVFTSCLMAPDVVPGRRAVAFPATETTTLDWNMLGWVPDGRVFGQYEVLAVSHSGGESHFEAHGYSDIDADGNLMHLRATDLLKSVYLTDNITY